MDVPALQPWLAGKGSCWGTGCLENSILDTAVREDLPVGCQRGLVSPVAGMQRGWRGAAVTAPVAVQMLQLPACCWVWGCCAHGCAGGEHREETEVTCGEKLCLEVLSLTLSSPCSRAGCHGEDFLGVLEGWVQLGRGCCCKLGQMCCANWDRCAAPRLEVNCT